MSDYLTGIFPGISHAEYHSMTEYVSNSYLGRLDRCPAAAKVPQEDTPTFAFGRAFHSFLLDGSDTFVKNFTVAPEINRRTKDGKEAWEKFYERNKDKTVISIEDMTTIEDMYSAVSIHPIATALLNKGRSETSIFWTDDETGLRCKVRPDRIPDGDHGVILDLKTVQSADIMAFTRSVMNYGYAREAGMYIEGFNSVSNAKVDAFCFICVEKEKPYRVEVYTLEDLFIDYGKKEFRRLIQIEAECRKRQFWPNWKYGEIRELYLPNWAGGGF